MSGGAFDYDQYRIRNIHENLQHRLSKMGKAKDPDDLWMGADHYKQYPEELLNKKESKAVIKIFNDAIKILKQAEIYSHRIDWYLSGDDGEEDLIKHLKEDLDKLKSNK